MSLKYKNKVVIIILFILLVIVLISSLRRRKRRRWGGSNGAPTFPIFENGGVDRGGIQEELISNRQAAQLLETQPQEVNFLPPGEVEDVDIEAQRQIFDIISGLTQPL
ncbi:hypothetical protein [Chengkuizengella sediminis]|uniref:hypothetical protein n=1 Tax=Chengkuizengella sediminis TaxID=1885917 RepID=UPI001389F9A9|nr:hypothetical protein [Chengkuizengella sediminis]NDI34539.1 hypothetical protein [Chengkuizengella sediminis]